MVSIIGFIFIEVALRFLFEDSLYDIGRNMVKYTLGTLFFAFFHPATGYVYWKTRQFLQKSKYRMIILIAIHYLLNKNSLFLYQQGLIMYPTGLVIMLLCLFCFHQAQPREGDA